MIEGSTVVGLALAYVGALFVLAWIGDRLTGAKLSKSGRPIIYALSLAVYCTSWTFYGSVGLAARTGYDFIPVYLGPVLLFVFGWPLVLRIVRLAKSQNITSVADFLAARYGKSPAVAAIVTCVAVAGTLPYIALQLKAVAISAEALLGRNPFVGIEMLPGWQLDTAFIVAVSLALFAVLFGTRHIDATEHQHGLMLAIAAESVVKLAAFIGVGLFVLLGMLGGLDSFLDSARASREVSRIFGQSFNGGTWLTVLLLSSVCVILLPRQFHVTVVENNSETEVRRAAWLFPIYLVLINLFVVPIAAGGLLLLGSRAVDQDLYVIALPLSAGADWVVLLAFLGGISAATAMVIVDSVALAIMICNGLVVPVLLRHRYGEERPTEDLSQHLLSIRRIAIFVVLMLGYAVFHALGRVHGLATIGLVSFAAIAQLAPAFFMGLIWRRGTARGAIFGILAGFAMWAYTLMLPWAAKAGWLPLSLVESGPLGIGLLRPEALFYLQFEPLTHGVIWSLSANVFTYIFVSLLRLPEPIERLQASLFVVDDLPPRAAPAPAFRLWRTTVTIGDLQTTVARYLGTERAERSFAEYQQTRPHTMRPDAEADIAVIRFSEHLLASAIGAASARLVLALLLRRGNVTGQSALRLLDDASEALQYNRDLLQSALDQVRHGLSVFDKDMRLICWNRQYRELLNIPSDLGRVGVPLDRILRNCAERGDLGPGSPDQIVADLLMKLAVTRETFQLRLEPDGRSIEIRTSPMPQGGIVTTYSDITERVRAATELARSNETLERRVAERTAELTRLNVALGEAKAKADEASLDKTRFLAAASHDILQPLNAARLYASSLVEGDGRTGPPAPAIARNIDASLGAVEEILSALLDISRLDQGRLEPEYSEFQLDELFRQLEVEFGPLARERGLALRIQATSLWVRSDRRLLRRLVRNLVSNAIKYTSRGSVVLGCRRRGATVLIQVVDTGPGIAPEEQALIFKEFHRLQATASGVSGLGLGLSIVERIGRVLDAPISLSSVTGRGSIFSVAVPMAAAPERIVIAQAFPAPPAPAITGTLAGSLVICVDNEHLVLDGMRTLVERWRCEFLGARSTEEAVAAVTRAGRTPDVILADYHLEAATGLDAIEAIRAACGHPIPAVVITADHTADVERTIRQLGHALLRKPVKAAALRAVITQLTLRRAAAE